MSNLAESAVWETGIYQLEQVDPVDAGTGGNGVSNLQALQLANRTSYLKTITDSILNGSLSISGDPPQFDSSQLLATTNWVNTNQGRFVGVKRLNATATLANADIGKLILLDALPDNAQQFTVPSLVGLPEGVAFHIKHDCDKPAKWISSSSELFVAHEDAVGAAKLHATSFYTQRGDEIMLVRSNLNSLLGSSTPYWIVYVIKGGLTRVGRLKFDYYFTLPQMMIGALPLNGALLSRADYPRLWDYVSNYRGVVTEAAWSSGSQNFFSSGDLSTTFRLPQAQTIGQFQAYVQY